MRSKLPEEWTVVNLKELSIKITKGTTPSTVGGQFIDKGISYYRSQCITDQKYLDKEKVVYIDEETNGKLERSQLAENDILFSMAGAYLGKTAIVKKLDLPGNTNQAAAVIRLNHLKVDYEYVYYYLNLKSVINYVNSTSSQSAQPNINLGNIGKINIKLAPKKEQQVIADTLSVLDDKIENNNKINKNLEKQAQEIFRHWFVDFEFLDKNGEPYKSSGGKMIESKIGLIPKEWEVKSLIEIAEFLNGVAIARYKPTKETEDSLPAVKIRELRQGYTDQSSDQCLTSVDEKYIIDDFDMIFSWSGSLLIDIWVGDKAILNQHLFKVTSEEHDQWYYYYWTKHFLDEFIQIAQSKATTMGHINRSHLAEAKVLLPDASTYKEMGKTLSGILNLKMKNQKQNQKLSELRDTLLPKLMSGELRIPLDE